LQSKIAVLKLQLILTIKGVFWQHRTVILWHCMKIFDSVRKIVYRD